MSTKRPPFTFNRGLEFDEMLKVIADLELIKSTYTTNLDQHTVMHI